MGGGVGISATRNIRGRSKSQRLGGMSGQSDVGIWTAGSSVP